MISSDEEEDFFAENESSNESDTYELNDCCVNLTNIHESDSSDTDITGDDNENISVSESEVKFAPNMDGPSAPCASLVRGLNKDISKSLESELDFFNLFFNDDLIELIVNETNDFANSTFQMSTKEPGPSVASGAKKFILTGNEFRLFLGLVMLMSVIKKPTIKMYFTNSPIFSTPFFSQVMTRNRFLEILRFMSFTSDPDAKKLKKIKPLLDILINKYKTCYIPQKNISVCKSVLTSKKHLSFCQNNKSRKLRSEVKIYKLCDSDTGYTWNCTAYIDKEPKQRENKIVGDRVLKILLCNLVGCDYNLNLQNIVISSALATYLCNNHIKIYETTIEREKDLLMSEGSGETTQKDNIMPMKNKNVKSLKRIMELKRKLSCKKLEKSIDIRDLILHHYPAFRKNMKWYCRLFFSFMDISIANANILYNICKNERLTALKFRSHLIVQIMEKFQEPKKNNCMGSKSAELHPFRLTDRHFPELYIKDGKKLRRSCLVCRKTEVGKQKRKSTYYECKICDVGLCVSPCFKKFHTLQKF